MKQTPPPIARVCFFGIYDPSYAHNRMLAEGFASLGYEVSECCVDAKQYPGIQKYWQLARAARRLRGQYVFVLALFPGHTVVWLARLLFPRTRVVFDAMLSLYDSNVHDRARYRRWSIRGMRDYLLDWSSMHLADTMMLDTNAHIEYVARVFAVSRAKCLRVLVGSDTNTFFPRDGAIPAVPFVVHFHGTYVPLQGIPCIIAAARLLRGEHILFRIIGSGQHSAHIKKDARDLVESGVVVFVDRVSLAELADSMAHAHVCLGIFGASDKAQRVIPNKVYEALAMGKPIITADTPGARELLDEHTAVLIPANNPQELAEAIRAVQADPECRVALGAAARALFVSKLLPEHIVGDLLQALGVGETS